MSRRDFLHFLTALVGVWPTGAAAAGVPVWGVPTAEERDSGRRVLGRHIAAHGGRERWESLSVLQTRVELRPAGAMQPVLPLLPTVGPNARFTVSFHLDKARLDLMDARNTTWGFDGVEAWCAQAGQRTYDEVEVANRVVQALKWYAAMPHKLLDPSSMARVVRDNPDEVLVQCSHDRGWTGDRLLASFANGRLAVLQQTAKAYGEAVRVRAAFPSWSQVEGVWLPASCRAEVVEPAAARGAVELWFRTWESADVPDNHFEKPAS